MLTGLFLHFVVGWTTNSQLQCHERTPQIDKDHVYCPRRFLRLLVALHRYVRHRCIPWTTRLQLVNRIETFCNVSCLGQLWNQSVYIRVAECGIQESL